ncbi:MAG: tetratricopeptide repeat protein [Candidatus Omnitrophica bacterium]|jgi:tetratricopeptide (TPR) repeat protein|nr:tetratricopeptide repeat protein [Candidatus Omnitrophota bacterium]
MKKSNLSCLSIFIIGVFFLISRIPYSFAQEAEVNSPGAIFYQANIYYQEAKYDAAIKGYQRLLDMGLESGNIYYNLGNSYFKEGRFGLAVLNYDKAIGFVPNDSDLKSNYNYVLQELNLEPQHFGGWLERSVFSLFRGMSIDALTILLSLVYVVLIILFTCTLFFNRLKRSVGLVSGILVISFILSAYALKLKIDYLNKTAVVIIKEADARFEPLENATVYFKLSEGSRVEIVDKVDGWYKVRRFDDKLAWVKKDSLSN